ncbi:MAG: sensor domain-containing diguanylate cyclase [Candidatus Firestonebacteria bacterium]|nr:sensor domain-containing diguanylate cyclase [Candidatus Firestonebacteria bacterium]
MISQINKFINTIIIENRLRFTPWLLRTSTLLVLLLLFSFVFLDFVNISDLYLKYGIFALFVFFFIKNDINNYWQIRGLQHMYKEFKEINRVTEALRSTMNLDSVLDMVLKNLTRELKYERAFIFLTIEIKQKTVLRGEIGIGVLNEVLRQQVFDLNGTTGIISRTAAEMKPFIIKDAKNDHRCEQQLVELLNLNEFSAIPLIARNNVLGVLVVVADGFTKKEISEEDLTLLEIFANQSAIAIQNARFFEIIERLSFTDELTGLYNHRYFQEKLREQFIISRENCNMISMIYFDIDDFKYYNDTFGHLMGDNILNTIGVMLLSMFDEGTCAARYGGEEFAIILTGKTKAETFELAERLRKTVETYEFEYKKEIKTKTLTISLGISSSMTDDIKEPSDLIDIADNRLYTAKKSGKNIVVQG